MNLYLRAALELQNWVHCKQTKRTFARAVQILIVLPHSKLNTELVTLPYLGGFSQQLFRSQLSLGTVTRSPTTSERVATKHSRILASGIQKSYKRSASVQPRAPAGNTTCDQFFLLKKQLIQPANSGYAKVLLLPLAYDKSEIKQCIGEMNAVADRTV